MEEVNPSTPRVFFLATLTLCTLTLVHQQRRKNKNSKMLITDIVGETKPGKMPLISEKGWEQYMNRFQPSPEDVIICTAGKSGTTWLQTICHFLRGGSKDFEDICKVVPWHIFAYDIDFDIMEQNGLRPRLFKSHQLISAEKRGCKYITTIRDPLRSFMSDVSFHNAKKGRDDTVDDLWRQQGSKCNRHFMNALKHFVEAYKLKDHPQVLVVCYEHLVNDTRRMLPTIAQFLGVQQPSEELLEQTFRATTKAQMLKDVSKYNERWETKRYNEVGRGALLTKGQKWMPAAKVVGVSHSEVSEEIRLDITSFANRYFYKTIGLRNYPELQGHIRAAFSRKTRELKLSSEIE